MNKNDLIPVITQEECAEVIQAISKVFRFGLEQVHPDTKVTNREQLECELGQLQSMIDQITDHWSLRPSAIHYAKMRKEQTMHKWFEYFPKD